ncbi:MAG: hypothetical protein ACOYMA_18950 [Bacteroidia bacterium]
MKPKHQNVFVFFCLLIFTVACNKPECNNSNPIFDKFSPDTKQYKDELIKQLNLVNNKKLRYWLDLYLEKDGQENLYFFVQGDGLCAKIILSVKQWNKIEGVKISKGVSYRGAEFKNLKFNISQDSLKTEFIYKDLDKIID